jgi:hypothetical protein
MVLSHINYCCIVWGCASQSNLNNILKLQNRAVRIILKAPFRAHTNPLFLKLKVLKIYDVCKLRIATFMYNAVHPSISPSLHLFYKGFNYTSVTNYNQYQTRYSMHKLYIPYFRIVCRKNSINCAGPLIWNSLQSHIVTSSCIYNFKKLLIFSLLEYYTL